LESLAATFHKLVKSWYSLTIYSHCGPHTSTPSSHITPGARKIISGVTDPKLPPPSRVLAECPLIVMLLFQVYPALMEGGGVRDFIGVMVEYLLLRGGGGGEGGGEGAGMVGLKDVVGGVEKEVSRFHEF